MKEAYIILDEALKGMQDYDDYCGATFDLDAAKAQADDKWKRLTANERRNRCITVCKVMVSDDTDAEGAYDEACSDGTFDCDVVHQRILAENIRDGYSNFWTCWSRVEAAEASDDFKFWCEKAKDEYELEIEEAEEYPNRIFQIGDHKRAYDLGKETIDGDVFQAYYDLDSKEFFLMI